MLIILLIINCIQLGQVSVSARNHYYLWSIAGGASHQSQDGDAKEQKNLEAPSAINLSGQNYSPERDTVARLFKISRGGINSL